MLITKSQYEQLGPMVLAMCDGLETPEEFWIITDSIIAALLNMGNLAKVGPNIKEEAKFDARVKLHANIRRFDPVRWDEARKAKGHTKPTSYCKGVYEYCCIIIRHSILKTITRTSNKAKKMQEVMVFDVADMKPSLEIAAIDYEITKDWLDRRLAEQGVI